MLKKIMPLVVMGLGAHEYDKKGMKMKGDLNKDGKMSGYEKKRSKAIEKAVMKKKLKKTCPKCGGKGCSHCGGKGSHSANTGDGTGAAQGKYK